MELEDQLHRPTGHFYLEVFMGGVLIDLVDEPNLIVNASKSVLAALVGGSVEGNSIVKFGVGTNGSTPEVGNTTLTGIYTTAVDSVTYPSAGQVKFAFSISSEDANGMEIFEFGLLTANDALFARKVRSSALLKTSDISISGSWTLTF